MEDEDNNNITWKAADNDDTTDLCTEKWYLSPTSIACVEIKAVLERKRNTGDTTDDIILDYSQVYAMHAKVGKIADSDSDQALFFDAQDIDFTAFYDGAYERTTAGVAVLTAIVYSLAF